MSIREKDKLDLELMSYTDIAYEIIKEDNKQYNTPDLFKEVCNLLELDESEFEAKIGDFFTALTTDKRFILIESVNWDLKENHVVKVVIDDGEEESEDDITDEEETDDDEIEENDEIQEDDYSDDAIDDLDVDDEMEDLTIIADDEIEE